MTIEAVRAVMAKYPDPSTSKPIEAAGRVLAPRIEDGVLKFVLEFPSQNDARDFAGLQAEMIEELRALKGIKDVSVVVSAPSAAPKSPPDLGATNKSKPAPAQELIGIKNLIAIGSGKGGVGKSTVTTNLAISLQKSGLRVGVLDADIFGPSQMMMLGVEEKPKTNNKDQIIPTVAHGVKMISIAQMIPDGEAIVWRGPMLMKAIQEFLFNVEWGELDVLLIDLPPGTGDVQLSLAQKTKLTGAIIVTTPQDIALIDARRAMAMFDKLNVPILGLIENMAVHICENCGHAEHIFGQDGAANEAKSRGIPLIGSLPLSREIRQAADAGNPIASQQGSGFDDISPKILKILKK